VNSRASSIDWVNVQVHRLGMQLALFDAVNHEKEHARTVRAADRDVNTDAKPEAAELAGTDLDQRVHAYTDAAHADNTKRAYRSDWTAFGVWCQERGECAMPASSSTLARYLASLADSGKKASTIRRARIAVGLAHAWGGAQRPDKDIAIRTVERGIARAHGDREEGADALLAADLPKLMHAFRGGPHDERDRAVVLLGFAGAFRASELVGLNVEQLEFHSGGLRIFVARSKEDQTAKGAFVDVPHGDHAVTCPVRAVSAWITRVGRPTGPLFRVVRGTVVEHQRMHVGAVSRALQRAVARAGLKGDYSAHSLRRGLVTSAHMAGHSLEAIQRHGRWQHRRSLGRYLELAPIYEADNPVRGLV
jgi:site-specific recombinase XerD